MVASNQGIWCSAKRWVVDFLGARASFAFDFWTSDEWRIYSVEWAEGVIQWLVDGKVFMRIESDDWFSGSPKAAGRPHAPFDQPFYVMLNLAVGGNLAEKSNGGGFDPASFPAELQVDWVRTDQCLEDWETGLPCLSDQDWAGEPQGPWEVQAR